MKLSRAQWQALFDLYMGTMIIEMRKSTMAVLARHLLAARTASYKRWQLTDAGRQALRYAPRDLNPYA